jgi:hypothetical protein
MLVVTAAEALLIHWRRGGLVRRALHRGGILSTRM